MQQAASEAQPVGQKAATLQDVNAALEREIDPAARAGLMLLWATGARVGCALQLRHFNVDIAKTATPQTGCFRAKVRFTRGKGAKLRGPFTVHTALPTTWAKELRRFMSAHTEGGLFPSKAPSLDNPQREVLMQERMLESIRLAGEDLSTRALRRGALQTLAQTLAAQGISQTEALERLMAYSGHTNATTLKRYLDWGSAFPTAAQQGEEVAAGGLVQQC
jgi:hypothetical protein